MSKMSRFGSRNSQRNILPAAWPLIEPALIFNQALALHKAGDLIEAEKLYRQVLKVKPDHFDSLHLLGVSYLQRSRYAEAVRIIDMALKINPHSAFAHNNRGNALKELKRFDEALESHDRAIEHKPDYADALFYRGNTLKEMNRPHEALASYDKAIGLKFDYPEALNNRGVTLFELNRLSEALASYDRAIALRADDAEVLNNRGVVLVELNRLDEALASFDKAIALKPDYAEAADNRGSVLKRLNRLDDALASHDAAIAIQPDCADAFYNRGNALKELNRPDEALASYEKAIALKPEHVEVHWNESLLRLLIGDFERGWAKYEWRWRSRALALRNRNFLQPLWLGADTVYGKTILLHGEQGLGDTIQFCRYAPLVAARGARVILEVDESLRELVSGLAGVSQYVSKGETLPQFDLHCPLLSLPLAFGTRLETIPSTTPYLLAPAHAAANWEALLTGKTRPRIGMVWSGDPRHKEDRNRSIALRTLLPLLDVAATFVSLQRDVRTGDAQLLEEQKGILHFGGNLGAFSDTAALISHLDLVITVDTSVAHLAGALNRPVWILLPFIPDWRWLLDRDDSPWYPTARLFRQDSSRDWQGVVERIRDELHVWIESRPTEA
jgi:tetratricopeptide (TPR) repeat protein